MIDLHKHRSIEFMAVITFLILAVCVLAIVIIHSVSARETVTDCNQLDTGAIRYHAKQIENNLHE